MNDVNNTNKEPNIFIPSRKTELIKKLENQDVFFVYLKEITKMQFLMD